MSKKPTFRLGRGLSSLISLEVPAESNEVPIAPRIAEAIAANAAVESNPPAATAASPDSPLQLIPIESIRPNPHQPRRQFDEAGLQQLAASLRESGLIQPVIARRSPDGFELIAGERRLRAAKIAGLSHLPAVVREADAASQAQLALIENVQREDLNPIDRAAAYRTLLEKLGVTQAELASRLGEERSSIANFVRLLDLPPAVQQLVRDAKLSLGHAKLLAGVPDMLEQQRLADLVVKQGLSVRNLEKLISEAGSAPPAGRAKPSAHLADLERTMTQQLGMRVQLRRSGKGRGRVVIHYGSLEQFDDLMGRLAITLSD